MIDYVIIKICYASIMLNNIYVSRETLKISSHNKIKQYSKKICCN